MKMTKNEAGVEQIDHVDESMSLFLSILLNYPQVGTINYNTDDDTVVFSFFAVLDYNTDDEDDVIKLLETAINTYHSLNKTETQIVKVEIKKETECLILSFIRDATTLTQEEFNLFLVLMEDVCPYRIVYDNQDYSKSEVLYQENKVKGQKAKNLLAYREDGKVMVFTK